MLDIKKIRDEQDLVEKSLRKKLGDDFPLNLDLIISLDDQRKILIPKLEELQAQRNKSSKTKPTPEEIENIKKINLEIKDLELKLKDVENNLTEELLSLPNIVADDVVAGVRRIMKLSILF